MLINVSYQSTTADYRQLSQFTGHYCTAFALALVTVLDIFKLLKNN